MIKRGDYITRNSYGNDTIFQVLNVKGDTVYLKGVYARLYADSPLKDCVVVDKETLKDEFVPENVFEEIKDREYYMFAEEAKERGVIDGIIGQDIELDSLL